MISRHLDKNNLHHAYLIEGRREETVKEITDFVKNLGVNTNTNPDFINISVDSFKIEDARNLKSLGNEKSLSLGKKIFLISANSILLEAQHSLLKMFEEPIEHTHFFVVVPDVNSLLKTLVSRFYFISTGLNLEKETEEAEKFIKMLPQRRIDFIKELLAEAEDEDGDEIIILEGTRSKALKFLNALESVLHCNMSRTPLDTRCFEHLFKVREFLRMPGSSTKTLMESVALVIPIF